MRQSPRGPSWLVLTIFAVVLTGQAKAVEAQTAQAGPPRSSFRLRYFGPTECPAETRFAEQVAAQLGYDPFAAGGVADSEVFVAIRRAENGTFEAQVLVTAAGGETSLRRELSDDRCRELIDAIALSLGLALEPEVASSPVPPENTAEREDTAQTDSGPNAMEVTTFGNRPVIRMSMPADVRPNIHIRVTSSPSGLSLHRRVEPVLTRRSFFPSFRSYQLVCVAPCEADIPAGTNGFALSTAGSDRVIQGGRAFTVADGATIDLTYSSYDTERQVLGWVGALMVLAGGSILIAGAVSSNQPTMITGGVLGGASLIPFTMITFFGDEARIRAH